MKLASCNLFPIILHSYLDKIIIFTNEGSCTTLSLYIRSSCPKCSIVFNSQRVVLPTSHTAPISICPSLFECVDISTCTYTQSSPIIVAASPHRPVGFYNQCVLFTCRNSFVGPCHLSRNIDIGIISQT